MNWGKKKSKMNDFGNVSGQNESTIEIELKPNQRMFENKVILHFELHSTA